jgi:hypothetical protein
MPHGRVFFEATAGGGSRLNIPIEDYAVARGRWPIRFDVPTDQARRWLQHLSSEADARGWQFATLAESTSAENRGSITLRTQPVVPCPELIRV